jgi:probable HAF family extracellular repeat protein
MNKRGQIVGESGVGNGWHGFLWQNGSMTDLGALPDAPYGSFSFAYGINDRGQIVGSSVDPLNHTHAILWTK